MAIYKAWEEGLKSKLAVATTESTRLDLLLDSVRPVLIDLKDKLVARDVIVWAFVEGSWATLRPSLGARLKISMQVLIRL